MRRRVRKQENALVISCQISCFPRLRCRDSASSAAVRFAVRLCGQPQLPGASVSGPHPRADRRRQQHGQDRRPAAEGVAVGVEGDPCAPPYRKSLTTSWTMWKSSLIRSARPARHMGEAAKVKETRGGRGMVRLPRSLLPFVRKRPLTFGFFLQLWPGISLRLRSTSSICRKSNTVSTCW